MAAASTGGASRSRSPPQSKLKLIKDVEVAAELDRIPQQYQQMQVRLFESEEEGPNAEGRGNVSIKTSLKLITASVARKWPTARSWVTKTGKMGSNERYLSETRRMVEETMSGDDLPKFLKSGWKRLVALGGPGMPDCSTASLGNIEKAIDATIKAGVELVLDKSMFLRTCPLIGWDEEEHDDDDEQTVDAPLSAKAGPLRGAKRQPRTEEQTAADRFPNR
eukprot:TRINITY_DN42024_c0_g1_i1.p1 TRINITY_DN42024_c0_g1~~TRINITY_DN42024_c0_g1_i1.p1  ORF type:complete len:221 (-),score=20.15 TRINITY_DN42024_c0_g1_i1:132-794(-)